MEIKFKRKFDVNIIVQTPDDIFQAFDYIWKVEQKIINEDPTKIKVASLSDSNYKIVTKIREKYNIAGIKESDLEVWNNKQITYKEAQKGVNVPNQYTITP